METNNRQDSFREDRSINFIDEGKRVARITAMTGLALMSACKADDVDVANTNDSQSGLPVGFDRSGGYVTFDTDDDPVFTTIDTKYPVLHFTGPNMDNTALAYTSLARLKMGAVQNREPINLEDSLALTLNDLVPTGELVVERDGEATMISQAGEMATFAAWSPTNPNIIAYSYARMSGIYGVATINTQNHERLVVTEGDIAPDYLTWDDKGGHVGFYVNEESDVSDTGFAPSNEEIKIPTHHFQYFDVTTGKPDFNIESQSIDGRLRFSTFDEEMEMEMEFDRGRIIAPNFLGNETMVLERTNENDEMERITFKAEQIRSRSENGIVFVNTDWPVMHLFATNGSGEPKLISGGASILYYIPMPKGSTTTFVQVGQSYSGSGCKVSSHTSSSSMKYAIDMQLSSTSSYDQVDASGVGTTYNSSDVTSCNYGDTSGCAANTSTCSKSFGNWVIISHADGYYTLYGHMEMGTTKPTTCGTAVAAGCWLGDQGFTGWTEGNNYDTSFGTTYKCGDHLHFQLQNGGSTSSSSVSVGFSEDGSITSSDCTSKTPSKSKATCSL